MHRVAAGEPLEGHVPTREVGPETAMRLLDGGLSARAQPEEAAPDEVLHVAHRQCQGAVAVPDAGELPLAHVGHLFDALLQGGDDHHRPTSRPLAEELEETQILY